MLFSLLLSLCLKYGFLLEFAHNRFTAIFIARTAGHFRILPVGSFQVLFLLATGIALVCASKVHANQLTLSWTDNSSNETGFEVERAVGSGAFSRVALVGANVTSYLDAGLAAATTYSYRVRAVNATTTSAYTNVAAATTPAASSPSTGNSATTPGSVSFQSTEVGGPSPVGTTTVSGSSVTMTAGGADIWTSRDQFRFYHTSLSGDSDVIVQLGSLTYTNAWAKAGIMWRASTASNAMNVSVVYAAKGIVQMQWRSSTSGSTTASATLTATLSRWLRLKRVGNIFTGYHSADGSTWTQIYQVKVALPSTSQVGLAVTSHVNGTATSAAFKSFSLSGASSTGSSGGSGTDSSGSDTDTSSGGGGSTNTPSTGTAPSLTGGDVGSPAIAGSTALSGGSYTVRAGGADIWSTSDQFHFARTSVTGDADIKVKLSGLVNTNAWAKAGLMLRTDTSSRSAYAGVFLTPAGKVTMQWRSAVSQSSSSVTASISGLPRWIRLVRSGNSFKSYHSADGTNWTLLHTVTVSLPTTVVGGLAVTSHATSAATTAVFEGLSFGGSTTSSSTSTSAIPAEPTTETGSGSTPSTDTSGLTVTLVGRAIGTSASGSLAKSGTQHILTNKGTDIWGSADSFYFASQSVTGDSELTVRVSSLTNTNSWTKAGLMYRNSVERNAAHVSVFMTPSQGVVLQWRSKNGGTSATASLLSAAVPEWIRLMRDGDDFYAFFSDDGVEWDLVEFVTVDLADTVQAGLALTSHNKNSTATVKFDGLTLD